jgi:O-antigen biosynthesis protein
MVGFADQARREARRRGIPLVYDTDDLLLAVPDHLPSARQYRDLQPLLVGCIRSADHVTVTTQALADELAEFNPAITILPNAIDVGLWGVSEVRPPAEEPVSIGYWGTLSHLPDLQPLTVAFRHLKQKYGRRVRFQFMGCHDPDLLSLEDVSVGPFIGSYAGYAAATEANRMDIAVAPLADHRFNRCKSPIKYLEYSIRGACGLYADLPPYQSVIHHGENGFLLGPNTDEWVGALERLVEDPSLRCRLARRAQADVLARHTLDHQAWRWREVYESVGRCPIPQCRVGSHSRHGQEV